MIKFLEFLLILTILQVTQGCAPKKESHSETLKLNPSQTTDISKYISACKESLKIKSFPTVDCWKMPVTPRYIHTGQKSIKHVYTTVETCLNPDSTGIPGKKLCNIFPMRSGFFYTTSSDGEPIIHSSICTNNQAIQLISYNPNNFKSCFFVARNDKANFNSEQEIEPLEKLHVDGKPCVSCHSPYPLVKTPQMMTHRIEEFLDQNEFKISSNTFTNYQYLQSFHQIWKQSVHASMLKAYNGVPENKEYKINVSDQLIKNRKVQVIAKDLLETKTNIKWDYQILKKNEYNLKQCTGCHNLGKNLHVARLSLNLFGLCDGHTHKDKVCIGMDYKFWKDEKKVYLHDVLFNTNLKLSETTQKGLVAFAADCFNAFNGCEAD